MAQVFINGLLGGINIALFATVFSLVYVPTRVFYAARGDRFVVHRVSFRLTCLYTTGVRQIGVRT